MIYIRSEKLSKYFLESTFALIIGSSYSRLGSARRRWNNRLSTTVDFRLAIFVHLRRCCCHGLLCLVRALRGIPSPFDLTLNLSFILLFIILIVSWSAITIAIIILVLIVVA